MDDIPKIKTRGVKLSSHIIVKFFEKSTDFAMPRSIFKKQFLWHKPVYDRPARVSWNLRAKKRDSGSKGNYGSARIREYLGDLAKIGYIGLTETHIYVHNMDILKNHADGYECDCNKEGL